MDNEERPFKFLFEKLTPRWFHRLFEGESYQTQAFILSFAPDKEYVEASFAECSDVGLKEFIKEYLADVEDSELDMELVRRAEGYIKKSTEGFFNMLEGYPPASPEMRKNMDIEIKGDNPKILTMPPRDS